MRHQKKIKKLGRTAAHRKATLAAMGSALIEHKRIETTMPKAKALRSFIEPLINRAKDDSTASRRQVFRHLRNKEAVKELFGDVASRIGDRPGGYTRVVKLGLRQGDAAELAIIELVDYNDVRPDGGSKRTRRTRRSSGRSRSKGSGQQQATQAATAAPAAEAAEAPAAETPEADDLTKVWGIGPVFATALGDAGITTFAQLAEADLGTLRAAIAEGSSTSDETVNEETWAEQAGFLATGDTDAHASYVENLKAEGATAHQATVEEAEAAAEAVEADAPAEEREAAAEVEAPAEPEAESASEEASAEPEAEAAAEEAPAETEAEAAPEVEEAPAADDASTDSDDAPKAASDPEENEHPDAPQGAASGEGEPPADTGAGDEGDPQGSGQRG